MSEQQPPADGPQQPDGSVPPPPPPSPAPPPPPPGAAPPPPTAPYAAAPPPYPVAMTPEQERTWGGAAHWSALVASAVGFPFLGPLLVMLVKGNESPWVRRQAVESLNFQLSMLIYAIVSAILILALIGLVLIVVVGVCWLVFTIIGAVKASNGEDYRYPLTIRMVS